MGSLGWEDPLEKEMATHSSTLAWKISWTENLVGYSPWGHKESDTTEQLHFWYSHPCDFSIFSSHNMEEVSSGDTQEAYGEAYVGRRWRP